MTTLPIRLALLCCALASLSGCFDKAIPFTDQTDFRLEGARDPETSAYLQDILSNRARQASQDGAADNVRLADYRAETIRGDLLKALHAKGYYQADVDFASSGNLAGTYHVSEGALYRISSIHIAPQGFEHFASQIGLKSGDVLDAEAVLRAQDALFRLAQKGTCYFNLDVQHAVTLNDRAHSGALTFTVTAGPPATFGDVAFTGQETVRTSHLEKLIPWKRHACYRTGRIERLRTRLLESGLFSSVDIRLPEKPGPDGTVDMIVEVKERAQKTVRAGLTYYTDEGPGATLGWEHRNFFGAAEKLSADLTLSQIQQSLDAEFLKPYFLRRDQSLSLTSSLRRQDTDAFDELALEAGGAIRRDFSRRLTGSLGTNLTLSRIEDKEKEGEKSTYGLVSVPATLALDTRDDKLNPHEGWMISGGLTPFVDVLGESNPFLKLQMSASTYYALGGAADPVLALRGGLGSILGSSASNVPATERFYAGGGGSVRGFGYQDIGPKDEDGTPTGGTSLVTASAELRFKLSDKIGAAAFVDAGSVTEKNVPDFSSLAVGAGVGLRYFTGFGPIRFDVAVPVSGKDDVDQNYQFYISIGQAF